MKQIDNLVLEEQQGQTTIIAWKGMTRERSPSAIHLPRQVGSTARRPTGRPRLAGWVSRMLRPRPQPWPA